MSHEKTFEAINKLRDIEIELHRLKNALELANKALDAQRQWVGLTDEEIEHLWQETSPYYDHQDFARAIESAHGIKEKHT